MCVSVCVYLRVIFLRHAFPGPSRRLLKKCIPTGRAGVVVSCNAKEFSVDRKMRGAFEDVMKRLGFAAGQEMETFYNIMDQAPCVLCYKLKAYLSSVDTL